MVEDSGVWGQSENVVGLFSFSGTPSYILANNVGREEVSPRIRTQYGMLFRGV